MIDSLKSPAIRALQALLNRALALDPATRLTLARLHKKQLLIESTMPPLTLVVGFSARGEVELAATSDNANAPELCLRGTSLALLTLALDRSDRVSFVGTGVRVEGEQELLRQLRDILRNLDLDWEQALAILVGDVPARMLAETLRGAGRWQQQARARAGSGLAEFVREEAQLVPTRIEMDEFAAAVRLVSMDVDRIGARIDKLQRRLQETESR